MLEKFNPDEFFRKKGVDPNSAMLMAHTQEMEKRRLEHELRVKEKLYSFAVLAVLSGMIICGIVLFIPSSSPDQKTWSQSTLTLIVGGALGLLAGKNITSESQR